jgi:hypothetical protein
MPTVQGKVTRPDLAAKDVTSVTVEVVDGSGNPVRAFRTATKETIVGPQPLTVTAGVWTAVLPDNAGLNPANTRYRRRIHLPGGVTLDDLLIVPVGGGPYDEETILAAPLTPLPTATPSNERDYDEITVDNSVLAISGLLIASIPNLLVTVPTLTRPCYVEANVGVSHSVANANVALAMGPTGLGGGDLNLCKGAGWAQLGAAGAVSTVPLRVRLPANSGGTYQLYGNGTTGNLTVKGATFAPSSLSVIEA